MSLMYLRHSGTREGRVERPRMGEGIGGHGNHNLVGHIASLGTRRNAVVFRRTLRSLRVSFPSKLKGYDVGEPLTFASIKDRGMTRETGDNDGR